MSGAGPLLAAVLLAGIQDPEIEELIQRLGSKDAGTVREARRSLTDKGRRALAPLKQALEKQAPAPEIEFTLRMLEARLKLSPEVSLAFPWIEEKIARSPRDALPNLLAEMLESKTDFDLKRADFEPVVEMAIAAAPTEVEGREAILKTVLDMKLTRFTPQLLDYLTDPNESVREFAAYVLVHTGNDDTGRAVVGALEKQKEMPAHARVLCIRVIKHLRFGPASEALTRFLEDTDPQVRKHAVSTLGTLKATESIQAIVSRLADSDGDVREVAAAVLVDLRATDAVPDIARFLDPSQPDPVRNVALRTLAYLGDPRAAEPISSLLKNGDAALREHAVVALGRLGVADVAPSILRLMQDDEALRGAAVQSLTMLKSAAVVPDLVGLVRSEDASLRTAAARVLAASPVDPVIRMFREGSADAGLILGLGIIKNGVAPLLKLLPDLPDDLRPPALLALAELGEASVLRQACNAATLNIPQRSDLLFAVNGIEQPALYQRISGRAWVRLKLSGRAREVVRKLAETFGVDVVFSDRCTTESLSVPLELEGVKTGREAFSQISRLSRLGFLFEESVIRVVPVDEVEKKREAQAE